MISMLAICGAVTAFIGTACWYVAVTGQVPGWLFATFGQLPQLRSPQGFANVPSEFWACLGFSILSSARLRARTTDWFALFVFAAVAGVFGRYAWTLRFSNWPVDVLAAVGFAGVVLLTSRPLLSASVGLAHIRQSYTLVLTRRRTQACSVAAVLATSCALYLLRSADQRLSPQEAVTLNFANWYRGQSSSAHSAVTSDDAVVVAAFVDYQCPYSGTAVTLARKAIADAQLRSLLPIRLVSYDFPLDSRCLEWFLDSPHPAACDAAVARRLVLRAQGEQRAAQFEEWLYSANAALTADSIRTRLAGMGLTLDSASAHDTLRAQVAQDASLGAALGVKGTPTVFVNGVRLPGVQFLGTALDVEVNRPRR